MSGKLTNEERNKLDQTMECIREGTATVGQLGNVPKGTQHIRDGIADVRAETEKVRKRIEKAEHLNRNYWLSVLKSLEDDTNELERQANELKAGKDLKKQAKKLAKQAGLIEQNIKWLWLATRGTPLREGSP